MMILIFGAGLIIGNCLSAIFRICTWREVAERSFFQAIAIIGASLISKIEP